jgi:hypothetical protein
MKVILTLLYLFFFFGGLSAFAPSRQALRSNTALSMAGDENDLLRWARAARSAGSDDNVVELPKPLGLVLNQDANGNVYVETVAPKGNAARTGQVSSKLMIV